MKCSVKQKLALAAAATVIALGCANLAQAETPSWCGPKKATLGLARWLRRQQLAPSDNRFRQAGSP